MWTFAIAAGLFYDPSGDVSKAYSGGNCGKNPEGVNNPDDEGLKNIGPLPEGMYTFGAPVEHSQLGPFAIPLIPDSSNDMYGRGDFYCHGDLAGRYEAASEGCVILPRTVREAIAASPDRQLLVVRAL
jgi:hypothetical protein